MIENVNSKSETGDPRGSFYPIDDWLPTFVACSSSALGDGECPGLGV